MADNTDQSSPKVEQEENGTAASTDPAPAPKPKKRGWDQAVAPVSEAKIAGDLTFSQLEALQQAKRFCAEQTSAFKASQMARQQAAMAPQLQRIMMVQEASQRQRAFQLMCRVYVGSINFDMREDQLRQAFVPFGPIKSVDLAWDNVAMKHKGFCFIEYETPEAAQLALDQMNGVMLGGRNIKCGRPSSIPAAAPVIAQLQAEAEMYNRIYVGSIHPDLNESDVRSVFGAFGEVKSIQLAPDPIPGRHRGFAFIEYQTKQSALDAVASMNLFDLGGQYLRVGRCLTAPVPIGTTPSTPFIPTPSGTPAATTNPLQAQATAIQSQLAGAVTSMAGTGLAGLGAISSLASVSGLANAGLANAGLANAALANAGLANASLANAAALSQIGAAGLTGVAGLANAANLVRAASLGAAGLGAAGLGAAGLGAVGLGAAGLGAAGLAGVAGAGLGNAANLATAAAAAAALTSVNTSTTATVATSAAATSAAQQVAGKTEQSLSTEESMSISGSNARFMVMQKLQRNSESPVIVLKNMVTVEDLDEELESEVTEECNRYGSVSRVVIYQEKQGEEDDAEIIVKIFVCFSSHEEAEKAVKALDGRWFGGKVIQADIYDQDKFENNELSG